MATGREPLLGGQVEDLGSRPSTGELKEIEPHVPGLAAIRVFDAGIVDYKAVCQTLATLLGESGCELALNHEVTAITQQPDRVELIANDTPVNIAATFTPAKGNWTTE